MAVTQAACGWPSLIMMWTGGSAMWPANYTYKKQQTVLMSPLPGCQTLWNVGTVDDSEVA